MPFDPAMPRPLRRGQPLILLISTVFVLLLASLPITAPTTADWQHNRLINSTAYKQRYGSWQVLDVPTNDQINTIHASLLPTGKVLLVAGSGNNEKTFDEYYDDGTISVLKTVLFDPSNNSYKIIPTPSDLFCSGHAMLQDGKLLIAGGTSGYEKLAGTVTKPAGTMIIHNENPDDHVRTLKKGTKFTDSQGRSYVSLQDTTVQPASKVDNANGTTTVTHSTAKVFVEATKASKSYITKNQQHYNIAGLTGITSHNLYGQGGAMTLNKQDYRGDNKSYEFDPVAERYVAVGDLNESRWYASLPVLQNGKVLAVSGLDNTGQITNTSEFFNPTTKQWTWGPTREFPTYPALFRTQDPNVLFFTGSTAGYGPATEDREPGFWNIQTSQFTPVNGLRDNNIVETSGSVSLPPAAGSNDGSQSWKVMIAGGGGIGESALSTDRTDIIDLNTKSPSYTAGPNLPSALRYINLTVTPWDQVIADGGSSGYRGEGNSYSYATFTINTSDGTTSPLADETVGRNYHSGSLLLPNGRILVFGGDPLYSDKKDTSPGKFEQRLEIFTPPQLYKSARPVLSTGSVTANNDALTPASDAGAKAASVISSMDMGGMNMSDTSMGSMDMSAGGGMNTDTGNPTIGQDTLTAGRGDTLTFSSPNASTIKTARLIPPSSTTHVTNVEQRSVAAIVKTTGDQVTVSLPKDTNLLTNGYYMLFVVNADGTPSVAHMVNITH